MKRKITILLFVTLFCLSVSACGASSNANIPANATTNSQSEMSTEDTSLAEPEEEKTEEEKTEEEKTEEIEPEAVIKTQTMGINEFEALVSAQKLRVIETNYKVQDEKYKSLYPDMLQAVIQNDTPYDIKNAVVAFVAWDENNLPIKIKGSIDFSEGSYITRVNYSDINLVPGADFGRDSGYEIDEDLNIATFKAIVVSYEAFTGETWENPYFDEWCKLYEGVKLTNN